MKKALFYILQFTWCLPQTLVGLVVFLVCKIRKADTLRYKCTVVSVFPNKQGSVSLGMFIMVHDTPLTDETDKMKFDVYDPLLKCRIGQADDLLRHEYGHTIQSMILGPLFLLVIGLPSIIWAGLFAGYRQKHKVSYYAFYTERWADRISKIERK